ncbi:MAG: hypothetical protein J6T19_07270 [Paludibacteraceae bacterium]|nr:hypothetical protein [Paludibacteraceae bacterium]
MKKLLKILGITLASVVGVAVAAVLVAVYIVFTPKHLTPVIDKVAKEYITCPYRLNDVELTFFSTFPEFGLRTGKVLIINPTEGAPSDTLLMADHLVARIELEQLIKEGCINVRELAIQNALANVFIAEDGSTNFDILNLPPDTVEEDTTAGFIRCIRIEDLRLAVEANQLTFVDLRDTISATLHNVSIGLKADDRDSLIAGNLSLAFPSLSANYKGVDYASNLNFSFNTPFEATILWNDSALGVDSAHITLNEAKLAINQFLIDLTGEATVLPEIDIDMHLRTNTWVISELLALVPEQIFAMPAEIKADGSASLRAHVHGKYNESSFPLIWAHVNLSNATGEYSELPYTVENLEGNADLSLDLNHHYAEATLNALRADVMSSSVAVTGQVKDILGNMLLDLNLDADLNLPDAAYFFPKNTTAKGRAEGTIRLKMLLEDLKNKNLTKGNIAGDLRVRGLSATMDSMSVNAPKANLAFAIPNAITPKKTDKQAVSRRGNLDFLSGKIGLPAGLDFVMTDGPEARLEATTLNIQLGDILNKTVLYADLDVLSDHIEGRMTERDSLGRIIRAEGTLHKPNLCGYVEYDMKDSTKVPTLALDFDLEHLKGMYDTIAVDATKPRGAVSMRASKGDKTLPEVQIRLNLNGLEADLGEALALTTGLLAVNAHAQQSRNKENVLLEWNPQLNFDIQRGYFAFNPNTLELPIRVPEIRFAYSNQTFDIDTARVELGNSNFSLSGKVSNIGPWLEDKGLLTGNLNFTSSMADIDQLLDLTSGVGSSDEPAETVEEETTDANPYMVPKGVNLTLNTHIQEARALNHDVHNLKGRVYVNDGLLVLEQMGFICKAARLELTAMYKTPRKNHIYTGLDYHMYDINVAELVDLIPQVDTLLPMLRAFKGAAEFHLAAETYLNGYYEIKPSTTRGACSIQGKDLTVLDGETFSKIAKLLTFKKSTENKIDSISAEITLFKKEVDVYPFLITMDKWMAAVGGQYKPYDKADQHNYHISLLNPLYLGVDVVTDPKNSDNLKIKLAKCKYAKDFKPVFTKVVDTQAMDIRKLIRSSLTAKKDNE